MHRLEKLNSIQKSFEIRDLAEKFGLQVLRNDVHTALGKGDGYAIDSDLRDRSIGTIAAPTTLSQDADWLALDLEGGCLPEELPVIVDNLKRAHESLTMAYNLVNTMPGEALGGHRKYVALNLKESLPSIERTISKINTIKP